VTDVVVIGGGITGLAAADRLARSGVDVTLLEATGRLGGKLRTVSFAGRPLDLGAEALAMRDPTAIELCRELSLDGEFVTPALPQTFVWTRRGLRPLPSDALTRLPGGVRELLRSRLLSPWGVLRCGWDVIAPSRAYDGDVAIGAIVRARLGREVLGQIVDPLLGGIHAGRCDTLSAQALAPQLLRALESRTGLIRGLRATGPAVAGPALATLRTGLGTLAGALAASVQSAGARVLLGASAVAVDTGSSAPVVVADSSGRALEAAACILATPAHAAARALAASAPAAAAQLGKIVHAPATVVALAYPPEALSALPAGTGFVTAGDARLVRACTFASAKWSHLGGDPAIVKAFVGRAGAPAPPSGDRELTTAVERELAAALGLRHRPVEVRIERFGAAIPQYAVSHLGRVERIEASMPAQIAVAGAWNRGAGVGACVRSGRAAADRVLARLGGTADGATHQATRSHA
jgi:oxygen-dependent protoporphyrinogen oxidase